VSRGFFFRVENEGASSSTLALGTPPRWERQAPAWRATPKAGARAMLTQTPRTIFKANAAVACKRGARDIAALVPLAKLELGVPRGWWLDSVLKKELFYKHFYKKINDNIYQ